MQMRDTDRAHWKDVVQAQGRSIVWLARQTETNPRTVYLYSRGVRPPDAWLARASAVLGVEVAA